MNFTLFPSFQSKTPCNLSLYPTSALLCWEHLPALCHQHRTSNTPGICASSVFAFRVRFQQTTWYFTYPDGVWLNPMLSLSEALDVKQDWQDCYNFHWNNKGSWQGWECVRPLCRTGWKSLGPIRLSCEENSLNMSVFFRVNFVAFYWSIQ